LSPNLTEQRVGRNARLPVPKRRYPVQVDLSYKLLRNGFVVARGLGRTLEFSDGKICFHTDRTLELGADLELLLDWPLRIDGVCRLQLVVFGHVIESDEGGSTLEIVRHRFRTLGTHIRAPREAVQRSGFGIHVGTTAIHVRRG
jgi:hypothetical protein